MAKAFPTNQVFRQRGTVLIAILALVGVGAIFLFVKQLNATQVRIARDQTTAEALALAKQALIGRAVSDNNRPGSLPCPDLLTNLPGNNVPGDGKADMLAGNQCPSYVGWLPWFTLGLPDLRDGSGERLWYALSPSLRDDDSAQPINSNTSGNLAVDATNQVAAIIFAPWSPLTAQVGRPSNTMADYLDGSNADGDNNYTAGPISDNFNDHVLAITRDELFRTVAKRILAELRGTGTPAASGLRKYQLDFGVFPWADTDSDRSQNANQSFGTVPTADLIFPPEIMAWLDNNAWHSAVTYKVEAGQTKMTMQLNGISVICTLASCP